MTRKRHLLAVTGLLTLLTTGGFAVDAPAALAAPGTDVRTDAAPAERAARAPATSLGTMKLALSGSAGYTYVLPTGNGTTYYASASSAAAAIAAAPQLEVLRQTDGTFSFVSGKACFGNAMVASTPIFGAIWHGNAAACRAGTASNAFRWTVDAGGHLRNGQAGDLSGVATWQTSWNGGTLTVRAHSFGAGGRTALMGDYSKLLPAEKLTATVTSVDHTARTAVVSGTATAGATVTANGRSTTVGSEGK